jgi:spheroidene monooxygenase
MAQFAHAHGAHKSAIAQVRQGRWFKEELYARFNITMIDGYWSDFNKQLLRE